MGVDFKMGKVTPFLMFQGNAEKAINFIQFAYYPG